MEVFDREGHTIIAEAMEKKQYYLALADVENGWGFDEEEIYDGTVGAVFGFIPEHYKAFVVEDEKGEIEHGDMRYAVSQEPTNRVFVSFKQRGTPIAERTIRQYIMVTGIEPNEGLENQLWWESDEMQTESMKKLVAENISPKKLNLGSQETLAWILVF